MGIQLAKGAGSSVSAVGKGHEACFVPFFVKGDEAFPRHVHFAPHFHVGRRIFDIKGDGVDGLHVGRHVFPYPPVAPGKALHQAAVFVDKVHGKAVDFKFRNVFHGSDAQSFLYPAVKVPEFIGAEGVGKVTKVVGPRMFGQDARIDVDFGFIYAIDNTRVKVFLGDVAKQAAETVAGAAGAAIGGMVVLGPVGIIGGAFVTGKSVNIPAGSTTFVQVKADTDIQGMVYQGSN